VYLKPTRDAKTVSFRESNSQKPPMMTKRIPERYVIIGRRSPPGSWPYRTSKARLGPGGREGGRE
jgi:hypothetical protein